MVVRTPSLVYIYLSIVSRKYMNENKVFLLSLSLSQHGIRAKGENLIFFRFSRVINSGEPSSDRVSLRSPHSLPEPLRTTSLPSDLHHAGTLFR